MRDAVIVSAVRTAVGRAPRGELAETPPDTLGMAAVREALARAPGVEPAEVEDVILGCAMQEGGQGLNVARQVALGAGLPVSTAGMTVSRLCASGLQALALAHQSVVTGVTDVVVTGGVESMSAVPMIGWHYSPNPGLADRWPQVYLGMGLTGEEVARRENVDREAQDAWGLRSHQRAAAAQDAGLFRDEIVPVEVERTVVEDGQPHVDIVRFDADEGIRRDTDDARMAALQPAFDRTGTVTAGNSSQMSDGAAAMVVMEAARAAKLGLEPMGRLVSFAAAGVAPEIMGIGPVEAVPKALAKAGLSLDDIGVIELNEAFAAQVIPVVRRLGMDEERVNVNGGAIALGHPLGATGAKLTVQLLSELARREERYGLVTMCVGGGQGAAGVIEWLGGRQPAVAAEHIERMEVAA
ncbi:MAG TPA: thiolase family protein [Miltoncostaeaceae bacterium]|jgi:acetyl-CoA acyltransferase|nr:thiolase family protein [Miltoncostaeaceae bacterium]